VPSAKAHPLPRVVPICLLLTWTVTHAGKPETRQYRVRYMLHDQPIGDWSDIVTTTFVP
jgi:hypothetical protein